MGTSHDQPLAVLVSGGLDSAILLAESLQLHQTVHPIYVRGGLRWEPVELQYLRRLLEAISCPALRPLQILEMPAADLYGTHWSINGLEVPDGDSPDEAVYLPGRNVLLLAKAILWCHLNSVPAVALAPLHSNPFPDATDAFFADYQAVVNRAINGRVEILRPYSGLSKTEVLARGKGLPLNLTFSCLNPLAGLHCGQCNKCAERRRAFADLRLPDSTVYHSREGSCTA